VIDLVVRRGVKLAAVGAALGVALAVLLGRALGHLLFGIRASDPVVLLLAPAAFVGVAAVAALVPASRLARFEPSVALQDE
jgi:putative ABC transport system permease protein